MSLVGTRPILQDELRQYELHHRARIAIKPGITGMWQVSGRSDMHWLISCIHKNDLFYIPAGTIHAIGAGALVAEIQESSNLTYRLYDYDRIGKDGKKRELHIDKALDVADLHGSAEPRQPLRVLKYRPGMASELLIRCKYFEV